MKIGKSIFSKLMGSFAIFGVLIFLTLIISLLLEAVMLSGGDIDSLYPYGIVDSDGNVHDISGLAKLGGWLEELEPVSDDFGNGKAAYNIKETYGTPGMIRRSYTADEIVNLTSYYGYGEYMGYFFKRGNPAKCFLYISKRENAQQPTIMLNDQSNTFWGIFLVLITLDIISFSLYLRHKIKRPLTIIVDRMDNLKYGDNLARIDLKTEAEFQKIVDSFNDMVNELEREKQEKNEIIQRRNQLMLQLSHDIKTPVATIKTNVAALRAGLVDEEDIDHYLDIIDRKSDRITMLAEDMFMMLKMDNPNYKLQKSRVDLCEFLRQICAEYYDEVSDAGFDFDIDIPEENVPIEIDERLFSRVVINLISNAKKYNNIGHYIGLKCSKMNSRIYIDVTDDGEPIDKELADRMFEEFVRGDKTRKSDGGTGLGLAISRLITVKHGGNLVYKYENDYNTFQIELNSN